MNTHTPPLRLLLSALFPLEALGLFVFSAYAATHWQDFTAQSVALMAWLAWFGALALYMALVYAGVKLLLKCAGGLVDLYRRLIEARAEAARQELLYTHDRYVVYLDAGRIRVQSTAAERAPVVVTAEQAPGPEPEPAAHLPAPLLSFHDLLTRGIVQAALQQGKMLLGYQADGTLRYGSWLDLYSVGIGGVSGSGKTTTVRFLLFQAVLAGARLIMVDPHIHEPAESLAAQFQALPDVHKLPPCDDALAQVSRRIDWLMREYRRRKAGAAGEPVIFVLDELNGLIRRLDDERRRALADLLLTIAQEGRKFGLYALLIGQRWSHVDLGGGTVGAAIRDSLASSIAHRFKSEDQARKLVGGRESGLCLGLQQGHFLFRDTDGELSHMITPDTRVEDGEIIARLLAESTSESPPKMPETTMALVVSERDTDELETAETSRFQALSQAVVRLQSQGKNKTEIMREVWGVNPGGSADYQKALEEYRAVMIYIAEKIAS